MLQKVTQTATINNSIIYTLNDHETIKDASQRCNYIMNIAQSEKEDKICSMN